MVETFKEINDLVMEWTRKAQSGSCTDDEKLVYYECAKKLHETISKMKEEHMACTNVR
jgi:hypothetical protein